jgi:hypothetical protein
MRTVLLVVGVEDQEQVHRARQHRVDDVFLARRPEHHAQEVRAVVEAVVGIEERLPDRVLVRVGRDRRHLRDQPQHRVVDAAVGLGLLVEGGERCDRGGAHRHRMCVLRERLEEAHEVLVEQRVVRDLLREALQLVGGGQLAVDQEPRHLEEVAHLRQLLDRVAAVAQDALLAVDERDRAAARAGVAVAGIERDRAGLGPQGLDVDRELALCALDHRERDGLAVDFEGRTGRR